MDEANAFLAAHRSNPLEWDPDEIDRFLAEGEGLFLAQGQGRQTITKTPSKKVTRPHA